MAPDRSPEWALLTNHAQALVCIARDPAIRLRDIGVQLGITERAVNRIVTDLAADRYITRQRRGRRNVYTVNRELPIPDGVAAEQSMGALLELLIGRHVVPRAGATRA